MAKTKTYLVTWATEVQSESPAEAVVKAMNEMKNSDNWQFHSSVEEVDEGEPFTSGEQKYCNDMCGNLTPCEDGCEDYKNRFNKD